MLSVLETNCEGAQCGQRPRRWWARQRVFKTSFAPQPLQRNVMQSHRMCNRSWLPPSICRYDRDGSWSHRRRTNRRRRRYNSRDSTGSSDSGFSSSSSSSSGDRDKSKRYICDGCCACCCICVAGLNAALTRLCTFLCARLANPNDHNSKVNSPISA